MDSLATNLSIMILMLREFLTTDKAVYLIKCKAGVKTPFTFAYLGQTAQKMSTANSVRQRFGSLQKEQCPLCQFYQYFFSTFLTLTNLEVFLSVEPSLVASKNSLAKRDKNGANMVFIQTFLFINLYLSTNCPVLHWQKFQKRFEILHPV